MPLHAQPEMARGFTAINCTENSIGFILADISHYVILGHAGFKGSLFQAGTAPAEGAQPPVKFQKALIFLPPGIGGAVKGIPIALHSRFIPVIDAGYTRQGELHSRCQPEKAEPPFPLIGR